MPDRLPPAQWFPHGHPSLTTDWVTLHDGVRLRVVRTVGGAGPWLVFVHGWGCSAFTWRHELPLAAAAGHRAIAVDLPGHGLSDKPDDPARYTLPAMTAALVAFLEAARLDDVVLVGHSMGGAICRDTACAVPDRVARLALLAPAGFGRIRRLATGRLFSPDWTVKLLGPAMIPRWAVRRSMERTYGARGGFTEAEVDEYWSPTQFPEFVRASRHLLHHFAWAPPPAEALAPLATRPVLVLLGGRDRLVVSQDVARYVAAHREVLAATQLEWLPEAGHALHEDSPGVVWEHLSRWLVAESPVPA